MKRLVKRAEINYNSFIKTLILDNDYSQNEISQIISENHDCLFSGQAYRIFFFYADTVKEAKKEYLKSIGEEEAHFGVDIFQLLWGTLDNLIEVNGEYQSFSKSENGIKEAEAHLRDGHDFGITIKLDVTDALDVEKLYNKYENQLDEETKDGFRYFKSQEEVLVKFNDEEYYYAGGFDMNQLRYL